MLEGRISTLNSTDQALDASASYLGEFEDVRHFKCLTVVVSSDVAGAIDGVIFEWSMDKVNVHIQDDKYTYNVLDPLLNPTNTGQVFISPVLAPYFRIKYINDVDAQTTFKLQTFYHYVDPVLRYRRVKDFVNPEDQGLVVKAVLTAQDPLTGISYPVETSSLLNPKFAIAEPLVGGRVSTHLGGISVTVPVSGTVASAGSYSGSGATIASGGVSQQVLPANPNRDYVILQNRTGTTIFVNLGSAATSGSDSFEIYTGGQFGENTKDSVHVFCAQAGGKVVVKERVL